MLRSQSDVQLELAKAVQDSDATRVAFILKTGADPYVHHLFQGTIERGDNDIVQLFLDHHTNPISSWPALMREAMLFDQLDIFRLLIVHVAESVDNWRGSLYWKYPFRTGLQVWHAADVESFLINGGDPDTVENQRWTLLHWSIWEEETEIVRLLLASGANPDARDDGSWTPLHWAVWSDQAEIVRMLLTAGADPDASYSDQYNSLNVIISRYARNQNDETKKMMRLLIEAGADPNTTHAEYGSLLYQAVARNDKESLVYLLEKNASPNSDLFSPLAVVDDLDTASFLLEAGADPTSGLIPAIKKRKVSLAHLLMDSGINPNVTDSGGQTPLHAIVQSEWPTGEASELIQRLSRLGADFNSRDHWGRTPLYLVSRRNSDSRIVSLLLDHGALEAAPLITISLNNQNNVVIEYHGILHSSDSLTGPYERVDKAESPYTYAPGGNTIKFFAVFFDTRGTE